MPLIPINLRITQADYARKSVGLSVAVLEYANTESSEMQRVEKMQGSLQFVKSLTGRGQPGFAGFFKDRNSQIEYLIKEDTPDTCVLEGSARFSSNLLPRENLNAVNFARAGSLHVVNQQRDIVTSVAISVQLRVLPGNALEAEILPWDVIVYGRKRNPKTLWSEESSHSKEILSNIALMSNKAQWDLACGIFISTVVGDESLHVGQFMAEREKKTGRVVGLTRIDFGARERYAELRLKNGDFKHTTSKAYSGSGQKGKHYVEYLLASPAIMQKYATLWERIAGTDFRAIATHHELVFSQEITNIPIALKMKAVADVWMVLQKKVKGSVPQNFEELCRYLKEITVKRLSAMTRSDAMGNLRQPLTDLERKQRLRSASMDATESHELTEWNLCREELRMTELRSSFQPFYFALLNMSFLSEILAELEIYKEKTKGPKITLVSAAIQIVNSHISSRALSLGPQLPSRGRPIQAQGAGHRPDEYLSFIQSDLTWLGESFVDEISSHRNRSFVHRPENRVDLSRGAQMINSLLAIQAKYQERYEKAAPSNPLRRERGRRLS